MKAPSAPIKSAPTVPTSSGVPPWPAADTSSVFLLIRLTLWFPLARRKSICYTLNHMVQYNETHLDASFAALSDATRRGVLEQLARADASITDLAGKFHMTLTGMKKHVEV